MIAIIRIKGKVKIQKKVEDTLYRLKLRRKYSCVIVPEKKEILGMLKKVNQFVAYGEIDEATLKKLIEKRGQKIDKAKKIGELKDLNFEGANLKPFFRLHPPRGGINTKQRFPKGVLGNHGKEINKLIERML